MNYKKHHGGRKFRASVMSQRSAGIFIPFPRFAVRTRFEPVARMAAM
jgi:hypothetical protein